MCVGIPPVASNLDGGDETYDLGEKHTNRTTRVTRNLFSGGEQFNEQLKDGYGWSGRLNQPRWHLNLETLSRPSLLSDLRESSVICGTRSAHSL